MLFICFFAISSRSTKRSSGLSSVLQSIGKKPKLSTLVSWSGEGSERERGGESEREGVGEREREGDKEN